MGLKDWKESAAEAVDWVSPYFYRFGKGFVVQILAPVLYFSKEIALEAIATLIAGGQNTWEVFLEPILERISDLIGWVVDETVKAAIWLWELITPWN